MGELVVVGLLHRMTDKLARACRLAQGREAQVKDERLEDTLLDLACYSVLAVLALNQGAERKGGGDAF